MLLLLDSLLQEGKLAIITGSAQGLGKAFAIRLLAAGAKVCLSDINSEVGEKTLVQLREKFGEDKVAFIRCDVTKKDDLVALYDGCEKHFDAKVDIFCNNAGINSNVAGWRRCVDINIMAAMEVAELVLERMSLESGGRGGLLVNTASLAGIVPGWKRYLHSYFASKHAVVSMTRTLGSSETFKETGVKVQCICPSFADTAILDDPDGGNKNREMLQKIYGILTVEEVSEGFMQLVKNCGNGAAVIVFKGAPPMVFYDFSIPLVYGMAFLAMAFNKVIGIRLLRLPHQLAGLLLLLLLLHLLTSWLLF